MRFVMPFVLAFEQAFHDWTRRAFVPLPEHSDSHLRGLAPGRRGQTGGSGSLWVSAAR